MIVPYNTGGVNESKSCKLVKSFVNIIRRCIILTKIQSYAVVIIGGGTAGISVAARLAKKIAPKHIAIIDPASKHYYQPLWTLVGGGIIKKEVSVRSLASLIPKGVKYIQESVVNIDPDLEVVETSKESKISYEFLVVCPGLQVNWDQVKGLKDAIGKNGVVSNYDYNYAEKTWEALQSFKSGNALFTMPNTPIKCGGAPQKIMYLAEEYFRKTGIREHANVMFFSPKNEIFDVPKYRTTLEGIIQKRNIKTMFQRNLIELKPKLKVAIFENLATKQEESVEYEMIHVTPPMGPLDFFKESLIADDNGWVDVDPYTLQHTKYKNIFSLGDASNLPTSKTGAAIRKQAPVVVSNLLSLKENKPLKEKYNGYTSCPIVTGRGKLIMAEFDYNKEPQETFPINQAKERYSMYVVKKNLLPIMYWYGMLKGRL